MVEDSTIQALPSKEFFISMLVRDIELFDAITDLADNSVEGAMRVRRGKSYRGYEIRVEVDAERFEISDNCGGIPVDLARDYAFRFGRPAKYKGPAPDYGWGQFGVGMKRALFKIGTSFVVKSKTRDSYFEVKVDVAQWKKNPNDWTFRFTTPSEGDGISGKAKIGTTIAVTGIYDSIADDFSLENFRGGLRSRLAERLEQPMSLGLEVRVNGKRLEAKKPKLLQSSVLKPAYRRLSAGKGRKRIETSIYAGITAPDPGNPDTAGWYVYCNGRVVLAADQTNVTGWGSGRGSGVPKYHNQYALFRGYVFFDAILPSLLPWKTTKTGVDENSPQWVVARQQMVEQMAPIITFLNKLDRERNESPDTTLETAISKAQLVQLASVSECQTAIFPVNGRVRARDALARISYQKPRAQVERIKSQLDLDTNPEVGGYTFDYYWKRESPGE